MGRMMNAILAWLSKEGWPYHGGRDMRHLLIPVEGESSRFTCIVEARETEQQVIFYAQIPVRIPTDRRSVVAEYIARVNLHSAIGSFDFDFDEGLVAYRSSIEVAGVPLTPELIRPLAEYAIAMADAHLPGILAILYKDTSPVEALEEIERYPLEDIMKRANEWIKTPRLDGKEKAHP